MDTSKVKQYRLRSGSLEICVNLKDIKVEDLIFNLYLPIKDDKTKVLIQMYEKLLILAVVNPEKFQNEFYKHVRKICQWIHKNHAWRLFADFSMFVFRNLNKRHYRVLVAYQCALINTWATIAPYGKIWHGLDDNDNPMFIKELYGAYDVAGYELMEKLLAIKHPTLKQRTEAFEQLARIEAQVGLDNTRDRNTSNIIYEMMPMINPNNEDFIFPKEWFDHANVASNFPRRYKHTKHWLDMLDSRNYLLNSEGVIVEVINGGMFKEIRFLEQFLEDGLIVMYQVTHDLENKSTMGYIDLRDKYLFNLFTPSDSPMASVLHDSFSNFILEVYANLTCQEAREQTEQSLRIVSNPKKVMLLNGQVGIHPVARIVNEGTGATRAYSQKALHGVNAFTRKGNASEMAKANARMYGLVLPQGYTFVRPHLRGRMKGELTNV